MIYLGDLSKFLEGRLEFEGLPICRTSEEDTSHGADKRIVVYPNGNVMVWDGDRGAQWNPQEPIELQPPVYIGWGIASETICEGGEI